MMHPVSKLSTRKWCQLGAGALAVLVVTEAKALNFEYKDLSGSFDSTFSGGLLYRLQDPDPAYYGAINGGQQLSVNADDGNLNYKKGIASQLLKGTHELQLKYHNFDAFVRGTYFYDFENTDEDRARTALSKDALERVGRDAQFLDAYLRGKFEIAGRPFDVRFGRQVLNLGESTFIPNGINVVNPVDASRLRVPGAELKEALLPLNMLRFSYGLSSHVSLDAYWLLEYRRTEIDPAGSYFSSNDFATRGGKYVYLGFGAISDLTPFGAISRAPDHKGNSLKQGGASLRITLPSMEDTEFGLHWATYNSRLPLINAITPTSGINSNLTGPLTSVFIRSGLDATTAAARAAGLFQLLVLAQTNPGALTPTQVATLGAAQTKAAIAGAKQIAFLTAAGTGKYYVDFPDNLHLLGASFNTSLGNTGIALQGEVSYKNGVPLQVDDVELLFAALSSLDSPGGSVYGANNQLGSFAGQRGRQVQGFRRKDVWTAQSTLTKAFGPMLGSSQLTLVGEIGGLWVNGLEAKDVLRYDGAGTFTSGSQTAMNNTTSAGSTPLPATPSAAFADSFSFGYQFAARLEYNNVFGTNILPSVAFVHDVKGNTPLPLGNFVEGRKSVNLAVEVNWQNSWSWELRYVNFFGAGKYNLLADRDFVSSTIKYSF